MSRRLISALAALVALASWAAPALASSGTITRATATWDWTLGSAAGTIEWTDCPQNDICYWLPYLSVQPAQPAYECTGGEAFVTRIDPNIKIAWMGAARSSEGVDAFDLPSFELLSGLPGQRLCLSAVYMLADPEEGVAGKNLAGRLLEAGPAPPPSPDPPPPDSVLPTPVLPAVTPTAVRKPRCPKGKRLVRRHGKEVCRKRPPRRPA